MHSRVMATSIRGIISVNAILLLGAFSSIHAFGREAGQSVFKVQIGSLLQNAFKDVEMEGFEDGFLSVEVNGSAIGLIPMKAGKAELKFSPLEGKNRVRFLQGSKKKPHSPGVIELVQYSMFPPLIIYDSSRKAYTRATSLPWGEIKDTTFEFSADSGTTIDGTLDITLDRKEYLLTFREAVSEPGAKNATKSELLAVKLDPKMEEIELASEVIETPEGVEQEYEISRTLEHTVSFGESISLESAAKLDLQVVSGEIRAKIDRDKTQSFSQSETIRRNLKIDGTKTPKLRVVWVGVFQSGRAEVNFNGSKKVLPFKIQTGLKPILKLVND